MRKQIFAYLQNDKEFLLEIFTSAASNRLVTNGIHKLTWKSIFFKQKEEKKQQNEWKIDTHTHTHTLCAIHSDTLQFILARKMKNSVPCLSVFDSSIVSWSSFGIHRIQYRKVAEFCNYSYIFSPRTNEHFFFSAENFYSFAFFSLLVQSSLHTYFSVCLSVNPKYTRWEHCVCFDNNVRHFIHVKKNKT